MSGRVGSDDTISAGDVAEGARGQKIGQEHSKGETVLVEERQLPIHRLDTEVVLT